MMMRWLPALLLLGAAPLAAQVTMVPTAADVRPTDPAFLTLQRLVERYGCIAGYPAVSLRGNRPLTRYRFASAINACTGRVKDLASTGQAVDNQDLAALSALEREFAPELAMVRARGDTLEARTATLEAQQFSTTNKLTQGPTFLVGQGGGQGAGQPQPGKQKVKRSRAVPAAQPAPQ